MPTVYRWRNYRFHFYSNEGSEPAHIHVSKDACEAKFWLSDCSLAYNDGFKDNELRTLYGITKKNRLAFLEKWDAFHG